VQAFLTTMPAASLSAMREGLRSIGVNNSSIALFENLMDSRTLFLTANMESIYAFGWLDLKDGPLVVETPPNVLAFVDDFWFHNVTDMGNAGRDQGKGGKYLFVPPGYKGKVPEQGYFVSRFPTYGNWIVLRGFLVKGDPKSAVESFKKHFRMYPLAQKANLAQTTFINVSGKVFNTIHAMDFSFFEEVNRVVQEEPGDAIAPEALGLLASIGIEKGKPFQPDERMKKILTEAAAVGGATARALGYRSRTKEAYLYPHSAWFSAFYGGSYEFLREDARMLDARTNMFFQGTGITPAMVIARVGVGSQYGGAWVDSQCRPFDGGKTYRLHLPPNIPVKNFWSVVVYDAASRSMLQNGQKFPTVSQYTGPDINSDGLVDIYFGPVMPAGKEKNWIKIVEGKGWVALLRFYGPLEPFFNKTWKPVDIEPISAQ
jgi:hypothetical protein